MGMRLYVPFEAWKRLTALARVAEDEGEISGLGTIHATQKKGISSITLDTVYLFQQKNTFASTELEKTFDPTALAKFMSERPKETPHLRFWWHTHPGGVFWSAQDKECIEDLGKTMPWLVSCVLNAKGDELWRFDLYYPARLVLDNVLPIITAGNDPEYEKKLKEELDKYIVKTSTLYQRGQSGLYGGSGVNLTDKDADGSYELTYFDHTIGGVVTKRVHVDGKEETISIAYPGGRKPKKNKKKKPNSRLPVHYRGGKNVGGGKKNIPGP